MEKEKAVEILSRPFSMDGTPKEILDAHRLAIAALEKQEQDRWIPVTENPKKPKYQFDTYLVYTKYERFGVADFFADGSWIGYDIDGDIIYGGEIIAWMPLPEPYMEDEA